MSRFVCVTNLVFPMQDGPNTIWPHDFHTGWSYCVTVPSWSLYAESRGSEPVVVYSLLVFLIYFVYPFLKLKLLLWCLVM